MLFVFFLYACKEDDFTYTFPELNQHLVAVTTSGADWEHRTEFVYDSLNRLSEIHNISADGKTLIESYTYNDAGKTQPKKQTKVIQQIMFIIPQGRLLRTT